MLPSGGADLEAADLFYAVLALREGYASEDLKAMLQRISPMASTAPRLFSQDGGTGAG